MSGERRFQPIGWEDVSAVSLNGSVLTLERRGGSSKPTGLPDLTVDLASIGGSSSTLLMKTADETIDLDSTYTDDSDLSGVALSANTNYLVTGTFYVECVGTVADIKVRLQVPSAVLTAIHGYWFYEGDVESGSPANTEIEQIVNLNTSIEPDLDANDKAVIRLNCSILVGNTGGTLAFQWAQNTSSVQDTTLYAGSWLRVEEIE